VMIRWSHNVCMGPFAVSEARQIKLSIKVKRSVEKDCVQTMTINDSRAECADF
jgi:hypothetical protein